jgi:hypothetical protein
LDFVNWLKQQLAFWPTVSLFFCVSAKLLKAIFLFLFSFFSFFSLLFLVHKENCTVDCSDAVTIVQPVTALLLSTLATMFAL